MWLEDLSLLGCYAVSICKLIDVSKDHSVFIYKIKKSSMTYITPVSTTKLAVCSLLGYSKSMFLKQGSTEP
jgi:hypothetical protein